MASPRVHLGSTIPPLTPEGHIFPAKSSQSDWYDNGPAAARAQIAAFLQHADVMAIEDAVYAFLAGDMPFAASAPTHTIVIESLSKRLAQASRWACYVCHPS